MFLPNPGGRFPVGATTFKLSVPRCTLGSAKVRAVSSELKHALVLEEVAFTAYYPADVPPKSTPREGLRWLLRFVGTSSSVWLVLSVCHPQSIENLVARL